MNLYSVYAETYIGITEKIGFYKKLHSSKTTTPSLASAIISFFELVGVPGLFRNKNTIYKVRVVLTLKKETCIIFQRDTETGNYYLWYPNGHFLGNDFYNELIKQFKTLTDIFNDRKGYKKYKKL